MRDQENPKELWPVQTKDGGSPKQTRILTSEEMFEHYLRESASTREMHGVQKRNGIWEIIDEEKLKSQPEWKKEILRKLYKENPSRNPKT